MTMAHSVAMDVNAEASLRGDAMPSAKAHAAEVAAAATAAAAPFSRSRMALTAVGLAATVGISAGVATLVASAIVSGAREERSASLAAAMSSGADLAQTARRLEAPSSIAAFADDSLCLDATEGEMCHRLVTWIMEDGARFDPTNYANMSRNTPFHEAQNLAHELYPGLCPRACGKQVNVSRPVIEGAHEHLNCDFGHGDSKPAHAGCFIVHNGKLLAEKLTYDHNKYDIPGGHSNWREPAPCTAYRETYEETGYLAAPRELLAVVRGGFHLYRCELLRPQPQKGHDHEISWVGWLDAGDVANKVQQHAWRFHESSRYVAWMR